MKKIVHGKVIVLTSRIESWNIYTSRHPILIIQMQRKSGKWLLTYNYKIVKLSNENTIIGSWRQETHVEKRRQIVVHLAMWLKHRIFGRPLEK